MNKCLVCKNPTVNSKYCSHSCRAKVTNRLRGNSFCKICGKKIGKRRIFCSKICESKYNFNCQLKEFELGLISPRSTLRKILIKLHGYKCQNCTINKWLGIKLSLELNHIDGNAGNNLPSNLELICPNCHSITPNWKAKNKGHGRKSRGLPLN